MTTELTVLEQTPLKEADPKSLEDLFDKDPLNLTDADITKIVAELRLNRAAWAAEEAVKATKPKRAAKAPKASASKLSLDDLFKRV